MKIFKELKKLGYIHYSATTIEELDDLPLNSAERVSEQALVLRWFRDKYKLSSWIYNSDLDKYFFTILQNGRIIKANQSTSSYELAESECLNKLIEICKNEQ